MMLRATPINEELNTTSNVLALRELVRHMDYANGVVPQVFIGETCSRKNLFRFTQIEFECECVLI